MDDIYVYTVDLPRHIDEMVTPCVGGYTVYLSSRLDEAQRLKAYKHALHHIENDDFSRTDVQQIEAEAHGLAKPEPVVKVARKRRMSRAAKLRLEWCLDHDVDPVEDALARRDQHDMFYPK